MDPLARRLSEGYLRRMGWAFVGIGIGAVVVIPVLLATGRGGEVPGSIGAALVATALGLVIVKAVKRRQRDPGASR